MKAKGKSIICGWLWALIGAILVVSGMIVAIVLLLKGETSVSNPGREIKSTAALSCEGDNITYPFFVTDYSNSRKTRIRAAFTNEDLDTISLTYQLSYDSEAQIEKSNTDNSIAMNEDFHNDGLARDALGMKFSALSNAAQMTLYAEASSLNDITAKYFLLNKAMGNYTQGNLRSIYEEIGLDCEIKDNNF